MSDAPKQSHYARRLRARMNAPAPEIPPPSDIHISWASQETEQLYGSAAQAWRSAILENGRQILRGLGALNGSAPIPPPGPVHILFLRRSDLNLQIAPGDKNGNGIEDIEDLSAELAQAAGCNAGPDQNWQALMEKGNPEVRQRVLDLMVSSGFMSEEQRNTLAGERLDDMRDLADGIGLYAMMNQASSTNLPANLGPDRDKSHVSARMAIVILSDDPMAPKDDIASVAGLHEDHLDGDIALAPPGLAEIAHEGGHAISGHYGDEQEYEGYCTRASRAFLHHSTGHETAADLVMGRSLKALGYGDYAQSWAHAIGIQTLLHNANTYTALETDPETGTAGVVGDRIVIHGTTRGFDPSSPGMRGDFDVARLKGVAMLPLMINTMVDALAGFVYEADQLKALDGDGLDVLTWEEFTPEERARWEGIRGSALARWAGYDQPEPADIAERLEHYARLGAEARAADPARHYAAMHYLVESGGIDNITALMSSRYAAAAQDMVDDYINGVHAIAPSLANADTVDHATAVLREEEGAHAIAQKIGGAMYDPQLRAAMPPGPAIAPYMLDKMRAALDRIHN